MENNGFIRDKNSGAIINNDREAFVSYKRNRERLSRLDKVENELADLKAMVQKLLEK